MLINFRCLSRLCGMSLICFLTVAISGQVTTVKSNRSGDLKIEEKALPVLEDSAPNAGGKIKSQSRGNRLKVLTEKPSIENTGHRFFCSTPNSYIRPRGKSDIKAVGAIDCGNAGNKPCYWTQPIIFIGFINGTPELKEMVRRVIADWTTYANVAFIAKDNSEYSGDNADIKVYFTSDVIYNSAIGIDSWHTSFRNNKNTPTMNLGFLNEVIKNADGTILPWVKGTVLHEFGHALGLQHEHQNPAGGIRWNRNAVIKDLSGPPNNWALEIIERNIFRSLSSIYTQFTQYDPSSIMHYSFPAAWTESGIAIPENYALSETDKSFIAGKYPRRKAVVNTNQYYKLTTWYNNKRNCLDIAVSTTVTGKSYFPYFVSCDGTSSGQRWKFTSVGNGNYRITNYLTGSELSMDDVGLEYYTEMRPTGNYSGQYWTITSLDKYFHLSSTYNGIYNSLTAETTPDTRTSMSRTGHWSNQLWEFIPAGKVQ